MQDAYRYYVIKRRPELSPDGADYYLSPNMSWTADIEAALRHFDLRSVIVDDSETIIEVLVEITTSVIKQGVYP